MGRRAAGVAGLGADGGDRSWLWFTVWILNLNKSRSKGSRSLCFEASWELLFFPLRDLETVADEIALQLASGLQCSPFSLSSICTVLCFILSSIGHPVVRMSQWLLVLSA